MNLRGGRVPDRDLLPPVSLGLQIQVVLELPVALDLVLEFRRQARQQGHPWLPGLHSLAGVLGQVERVAVELQVVGQHAQVVVVVVLVRVAVGLVVGVEARCWAAGPGLEGRKALPLPLGVLLLLPLVELLAVLLVVPLLVAPVALALAALALSTFASAAPRIAFAFALADPIYGALGDVGLPLAPLLLGVVVLGEGALDDGIDVHGRLAAAGSGLIQAQLVCPGDQLLGELRDVLLRAELPPGLDLGVVLGRDHLEDDGYPPLLLQGLAGLLLVHAQVSGPLLDGPRQLANVAAALAREERRHAVEHELFSRRVVPLAQRPPCLESLAGVILDDDEGVIRHDGDQEVEQARVRLRRRCPVHAVDRGVVDRLCLALDGFEGLAKSVLPGIAECLDFLGPAPVRLSSLSRERVRLHGLHVYETHVLVLPVDSGQAHRFV